MQTPGATGAVPLLLLSGGLSNGLEARHLAQHCDALAGRQGDVTAGAVGLAEAALDAAVHDGVGGGALLQVLQVKLWVLQTRISPLCQFIVIGICKATDSGAQ